MESGPTHIILLDKFVGTPNINAKRAKHALALAQTRLFPLLVLDINVERLTLEKELQVGIMLQRRVRGRLVEHFLESRASRLNEIALEATDGLLLWRRRHHDTRIVGVQRSIQPQKIAIPPLDLKLGLLVGFGRSLRPWSVSHTCLPARRTNALSLPLSSQSRQYGC
jgi:hypothetical protein